MADEDEWEFPLSSGATHSKPATAAEEEDDWGFPIDTTAAPAEATQSVTTNAENDDEDEWGFSTALSKDAAPKPNKAPLNEDEWGFPTTTSTATPSSDDPSDLLAKWGFDSEPSTPESTASPLSAAESLFEGWKTATRANKLGTSLSTLTTILSNLSIPGPRHLAIFNLRDSTSLTAGSREFVIGQGTQFTVYRDIFSAEADDGSGTLVAGKGLVIKRARISRAALKAERNLAANESYRQTLRHLELEVLSLGLLQHRNVVRLAGWGYDYEDRHTPVPVLFMEAALMSLTDLLQVKGEGEGEGEDEGPGPLAGLGARAWAVRYQLVLDVAAGLEALHAYNIVHGDVKPDNILVFHQDHAQIPYVGKLSDFGVCVDMRTPGRAITPETYLGTEAWTGSEVGVGGWRTDVHGEFEPELLKRFDSYSFGLLLLATICGDGNVPDITKEPGPSRAFGLFMEIEEVLEKARGCPEEIVGVVKDAAKKFLAVKPADRPLPSPRMLQTNLVSYDEWLKLSVMAVRQDKTAMRRGHLYWFRLDSNVLESLDQDFCQQEAKGRGIEFTGETLFGLTLAYSQEAFRDRDEKVLKYVLAAAKRGSVPARAICERVYEALDGELTVDKTTLEEWKKEAIRDGYLFATHPFLENDAYLGERQTFRDSGGYCNDAFKDQKSILSTANDIQKFEKWLFSNKADSIVDSSGNTMLHVCAALGHLDSLTLLLLHSKSTPVNESGETPLYKACQAGHTAIVHLLLEHGYTAQPSTATGASPLHWLFTFPEADIPIIAEALVNKANNDVNHLITHPSDHRLTRHFPFEWPPGTPLHWATFARNKSAMTTLLSLGANINATHSTGNPATTPLAQSVFASDAPLVQHLLSHGAALSSPQDHNPTASPLLHILSLGAGNENTLASQRFDPWVRHGRWSSALAASRSTITSLLAAGIPLSSTEASPRKYTPLMSAVQPARRPHVVAALLDAGADANAVFAANDSNALMEWCDTNPHTLQYPQAYTPILQMFIQRTHDLNVRGGAKQETCLHNLLARDVSAATHEQHLTLFLESPTHRADINLGDRDGTTPLMKACAQPPAVLLPQLTLLLHHGAHAAARNTYDESVIHALVSNFRLQDAASHALVKHVLAHPSFPPTSLPAFIAGTHISALGSCAAAGRPMTLALLLDLGFAPRINEAYTLNGMPVHVLDEAYRAADAARLGYIRRTAELLPHEFADLDADAETRLYASSAGLRKWSYSGPSAARVREAYWGFRAVLEQLRACGAEREGVLAGKSVQGASWSDAVELPGLGMSARTQPHREHWSVLYEIEGEWVWEEEAWEEFRSQYEYLSEEDLRDFDVPVMVFERWPRVVEVLPGREGWYRGVLRDGRRVEVKMGEGGIEAMRDGRGRAVRVEER